MNELDDEQHGEHQLLRRMNGEKVDVEGDVEAMLRSLAKQGFVEQVGVFEDCIGPIWQLTAAGRQGIQRIPR